MGRIPSIPQDAWQASQQAAADLDARQRASHLGRMTARGGASRWADAVSGNVHTTLGDLGDGTNGLSTDGRIAATGAVSAGSASVSGAVAAASVSTTGTIAAGGALTAPDHNASQNVPTLGGGNGAKVWVQSSDPGVSAANGDLWFQA